MSAANKPSSTDRIEKVTVLKAPRSKVWRALTEPSQFGQWFHVDLAAAGRFEPGARISGKSTYPGHEGQPIDFTIDRVEHERLFSYRWPADERKPGADVWAEPLNTVVFTLDEVDGGTRLTIVESGFDQLPPDVRERQFRGNTEGWAIQLDNITRHVT